MAKTLPNINKPVPEATDPALIKPVSDAIEAVDQAIGAKPSTLTTTAKTIVPAVNEIKGRVDTLDANSSLLTPSPPFTSSYFTGLVFYKVGRLVIVNGNAKFTQSVPPATITQVGTIPVGYRPTISIDLYRPQPNSTLRDVLIQFLPDGKINVYQYGTVALPVNGIIDCNVAYVIPS